MKRLQTGKKKNYDTLEKWLKDTMDQQEMDKAWADRRLFLWL